MLPERSGKEYLEYRQARAASCRESSGREAQLAAGQLLEPHNLQPGAGPGPREERPSAPAEADLHLGGEALHDAPAHFAVHR